MVMQIHQIDMFPETQILEMVVNLKNQMENTRKKAFAKIDELQKEVSFLSLQLEIMVENQLTTQANEIKYLIEEKR